MKKKRFRKPRKNHLILRSSPNHATFYDYAMSEVIKGLVIEQEQGGSFVMRIRDEDGRILFEEKW